MIHKLMEKISFICVIYTAPHMTCKKIFRFSETLKGIVDSNNIIISVLFLTQTYVCIVHISINAVLF